MTKIFTIILNWNRPDDTLECLKSLSRINKDGFENEIVIVDNASSDNSINLLKKYVSRDSNYKILINNSNLGFAEGNNIGIRYALEHKAEYVLVLNNDTVVEKNMLIELFRSAKKHPQAGAISPKIYFEKGFEFHKDKYQNSELGKIIWYAGGSIDWNNVYGANRGVDEVDKSQFADTEETDFFTGACVLFNSKSLREVGLFDKKYYMYLEDADLSMRMKKQGWGVLYTPKALIWHKVAGSSGIGSDLNDYFISRNRLLFGLKYAPTRSKLALIKESIKFAISGRQWQKVGIKDFYLRRFGQGSWSL
jgi:hypothetical protein